MQEWVRVMVMGDVNGQIDNRVKGRVTGAFGVNEKNKNCKRIVSFWAEMGCVLQTHSSSTVVHTKRYKE